MEVSLIGILDADKQGFLRTTRSLIQTIGRAARNVNGRVIMYADKNTKDMQKAIYETNRRREIQMNYNKEHNIEPASISKDVRNLIERIQLEPVKITRKSLIFNDKSDTDDFSSVIDKLEVEMNKAAQNWEFERAAMFRDEIIRVKGYRDAKRDTLTNIRNVKKQE
jgi:excinuclease ABC subunit B